MFDIIKTSLLLHWGEQIGKGQGEVNEKNSDRWIKRGELQHLQKSLEQYKEIIIKAGGEQEQAGHKGEGNRGFKVRVSYKRLNTGKAKEDKEG